MVSSDDVADIVIESLRQSLPSRLNYRETISAAHQPEGRWGFHVSKPFNKPYTSLQAKRIFLSEYDIKRLLRPGDKTLRVPKAAIISPLAQEWLEAKEIKIEQS